MRGTFEALLADFPVLVLPALLHQPPLLGEHGFSLTALTAPVNLAGLPALALPVPAPDGMIASMQVIGASEERVLAFGRVIRSRRPPLSARLTTITGTGRCRGRQPSPLVKADFVQTPVIASSAAATLPVTLVVRCQRLLVRSTPGTGGIHRKTTNIIRSAQVR